MRRVVTDPIDARLDRIEEMYYARRGHAPLADFLLARIEEDEADRLNWRRRVINEEFPQGAYGGKMNQHYRVGPGKCACGFDAYKINGFFIDYHNELQQHIAAVRR